MKIHWNENPLRTVVELDDYDKEVFKLKIKVSELEDRLVSIDCSLKEDQFFDLERARRDCLLESFLQGDEEPVRLTKRVDELFNWYLEELAGEHCGDCTKVACSCIKCIAEDLIGVNTVEGCPSLSSVCGAFTVYDGEGKRLDRERSLDEALEYLRLYRASPVMPESWRKTGCSQESYEGYAAGWERDAREAYVWLKRYEEEHFNAS